MKNTQTVIKHLALLLALSFLFVTSCAAQEIAPKLDEYLSAITKQGRFSGSVLVARDGKVILSKGYGLANVEWDAPNAPQTRFRLGSITKQFTAASILLLQERGKLSVQDPICKYFTDCPSAWSEVTLHHLLTHTGGIPNFTSFPDYQKTMMIPVTVESLVARFKDKPLDFKPGEKWSYSNSGYELLGYIIEKASGQSYEPFLQANIFGPLRMTSSGYDHYERIIKQRATGYSRQGSNLVNSPYLDMTIPYAAGSLYSTVEDLYLWEQSLFGSKLLAPKSLEAMLTPVKNDYAYGLAVNQQFNHKMVSHGGGINGFATFLAHFPDDKLTIVVLRNSDGGSPNPGVINHDLAAIVFGEKYEIPREHMAIKVDPKIFDAYVGQYELAPNFIFTITREGDRLMAQATGQGKLELHPESETKFFITEVDAQITFVKDSQGQVTQLILHQGLDRLAKKIK
jgi:CubicO group peptidase (beta-lactamase class C family)